MSQQGYNITQACERHLDTKLKHIETCLQAIETCSTLGGFRIKNSDSRRVHRTQVPGKKTPQKIRTCGPKLETPIRHFGCLEVTPGYIQEKINPKSGC